MPLRLFPLLIKHCEKCVHLVLFIFIRENDFYLAEISLYPYTCEWFKTKLVGIS